MADSQRVGSNGNPKEAHLKKAKFIGSFWRSNNESIDVSDISFLTGHGECCLQKT